MLQQRLVEQQSAAFVAAHAQCDHWGKSRGIKGHRTRTCRTLFGTVTLTSPRLYHCSCQRRKTTTFRPLNALLTDAVTPELLFMETTWASLVSYGLTAPALKDFLPVDATLNATTIQKHTLAVAQGCEDELGEEQWAFVGGCPAAWETRGTHQHRFCRIHGQLGDQQALLQTLADAVDPAWCPSVAANTGENPESGVWSSVPTLVSRSAAGGKAPGGVTPSYLMVSASVAAERQVVRDLSE